MPLHLPNSPENQQRAIIGQLRMQTAVEILARLAPIDFQMAVASEEAEANKLGHDVSQITIDTMRAARLAVAYADALLVAAGVVEEASDAD